MATTIVRGGPVATGYSVFRADSVIHDGAIAAPTADAGQFLPGWAAGERRPPRPPNFGERR
jgi:hypothetical protein